MTVDPGAQRRALAIATPVLLCGLLLAQASYFQARKSITYDETFYVGAALASVHAGRLDSRLATWGVAPLPVLVDYLAPSLVRGGEVRRDLWKGQPEDPAIVATARKIHVFVVGCGLVMVVYCWLLARRGWTAATLGTALLVLSPTVVAHSALATTDGLVVVLVLMSLVALDRFSREPSFARLLVAAASIAAAISAKYSALFLIPVAGLWLLWLGLPGWRGFGAATARFTVLVAMVAPLVWAFHGFTQSEPLTPRTPRALRDPSQRWPSPLVGIRAQLVHQQRGHPAFLSGERSEDGWLSYYPVAFAVKSTPAELLLFGAAIVVGVVGSRGSRKESSARRSTRGLWALTACVYVTLALASPVATGHRHLLLLYPLLVLWCVDFLWEQTRWHRVLVWGLGGAVALQLWSAARITPDYLAYFNSLSGGPSRGHERLVDSNLDWGQDLVALREQLEASGSRCALFDYFGTADLSAYALPVVKLGRSNSADLERCDHLAVSVTKLQEVHRKNPAYAQLREREPDARAGYSIFIYALSGLPEDLKAGLLRDR